MPFSKDNIHDWISDYLTESLPTEEKGQIEKLIQDDPGLRKEVREMALVDYGLSVAGTVDVGHPSSEDLAEYATDPRAVSRSVREDIEDHVRECSRCREELELCRQALADVHAVTRTGPESWLGRIRKHLTMQRFAVRPAYAYGVAVVALAAVALLSFLRPVNVTTARVELATEVKRSTIDGLSTVVLQPTIEVVTLQFTPSIKQQTSYQFELVGPDDRVILVYTGNVLSIDSASGLQLPFAIEVPVSYLIEGSNKLRVVEELAEDQKGKPDTVIVDFEVRRSPE